MQIRCDLTDVFDHIRANFTCGNRWSKKSNACVEYILDLYQPTDFDSVDSFCSDLELGLCANGSFGGDMIYTARILEKLADESWRDAIDTALEEYQDATGESPTFDPVTLESLVTFTTDWFAGQIASYVRSHNRAYIVTIGADEAGREDHAFLFESDAESFLEERNGGLDSMGNRLDGLAQDEESEQNSINEERI